MATVPVTRTFVAGEVVLASYFNTNIRDVLNYLVAPPILEIRQTVSQNLTSGTQAALTFTTEDVDSSGMHSTSSNTSRATAVYPGWYQFSGGTTIASNATGRRTLWWAVNTVQVTASQVDYQAVTSGVGTAVASRVKHLFLNVSDYAELIAFQDSGSTLATGVSGASQSNMSARWVSN